MSLPRCRRRVRERSCERRCAASHTEKTSPCRRPSRTRPCSTRCVRFFSRELSLRAAADYWERVESPVELARGDGSIATLNAVHSGLAMTTIAMLGSEEQQAQYLPEMATCEILGAFALTEPNPGSDVVALETRARRQGDGWVLDGQKR